MANRIANIETNVGTIRFELLDDESPKTAENFRLLAEAGKYDGVIFHRVIKGFMIQGGDPTGTGRGGQSAWGGRFNDEINRASELYRGPYARGTVAMANAGPNTNGSQFFIVTADACPWLDGKHTVFGQVSDGMDAVERLEGVATDSGDKPQEPIAITSIELAG